MNDPDHDTEPIPMPPYRPTLTARATNYLRQSIMLQFGLLLILTVFREVRR